MAKCNICGKEGCSCQMKEGVCKECRKKAQSQPIEQPKINIKVNLPKTENSDNLRS